MIRAAQWLRRTDTRAVAIARRFLAVERNRGTEDLALSVRLTFDAGHIARPFMVEADLSDGCETRIAVGHTIAAANRIEDQRARIRDRLAYAEVIGKETGACRELAILAPLAGYADKATAYLPFATGAFTINAESRRAALAVA